MKIVSKTPPFLNPGLVGPGLENVAKVILWKKRPKKGQKVRKTAVFGTFWPFLTPFWPFLTPRQPHEPRKGSDALGGHVLTSTPQTKAQQQKTYKEQKTKKT